MAKRIDPHTQKTFPHNSGSPRVSVSVRKQAAQAGNKDRADWVASQLRELYGEVTREPVPESLLELLRKIKEADNNG